MALVLLVRGGGTGWPPFSSLVSKVINILGLVPKIITRPLGLSYLSASVRKKGDQCEILDLQTCPTSKRLHVLKEKIRKNNYDFVGFTFFTSEYPDTLKMTEICKEQVPQIRTIWGGPHASFTYQDILRNSFADFVIIGEGEKSLPELISDGNHRNISGLAYREGDKIISNPAKVIEDIDSLPMPDRERCTALRFPYAPIDYIQTSRGCPKKCSFCVESRLFRTIRFRDPKSVVDEIKQLIKQERKILYLADSNFSASKNHVESLCKEVRKNNLKVNLFAEMSIEFTDKEMLKTMSESCFVGVAFGIESLTNQSLTNVDKTFDGEEYKRKCMDLLGYCKKIGLNCSSYYIVPLQYQSKESVIEEIKLLQTYGQVELMFLTPFPGTPLWEESKGHLLTQDFSKFDSYHLVYNPSEIGQKDLGAMYRFVVKENRRLAGKH